MNLRFALSCLLVAASCGALHAVHAARAGQGAETERRQATPPHVEHPGTGVKAHYAHFKSTAMFQAFGNRKSFLEAIAECRSQMKLPPFDERELPGSTTPVDLFIYSSADRSVVFNRVTIYGRNIITCDMTISPHRFREIETRAGTCKLDEEHKAASGRCDFTESRLKLLPRGGMKADGTRTIRGHQCDLFTYAPLKGSTCISYDGSFVAFPSARNPAGNRLMGLPLQFESVLEKMELVDVQFDLPVDPSLFEIPAGYTIRNVGPK